MTPCTKARVQTAFLRLLTVAVAAVGVWYATEPVAQYFQWSITDAMAIGVASVAGFIALLISWRLFDFAQDCMSVPESATSGAGQGRSSGRRCSRGSCELNYRNDQPLLGNQRAQPQILGITDDAARGGDGDFEHDSPCRAARRSGLLVLIVENERVKVELKPETPGEATVLVTATGLTASQFKGDNGFRRRLERISGVSWKNPVNKGDGVRVMEGKIVETSSDGGENALARIQDVAESYS